MSDGSTAVADATRDHAPLTKIAVGIDYETDQPWIWTGESVVEDCEDTAGWFVVEVPANLAAAFTSAVTALNAAVEVIHEHVGYDAQRTRLREPCNDYTGTPIVVGRRAFHDDCDRCGWKHEDHR